MINDYGLEFMLGDTVKFKPKFSMPEIAVDTDEGVILGAHGHFVDIGVGKHRIDNNTEYEMIIARLVNEVLSVTIKAESQLSFLD